MLYQAGLGGGRPLQELAIFLASQATALKPHLDDHGDLKTSFETFSPQRLSSKLLN